MSAVVAQVWSRKTGRCVKFSYRDGAVRFSDTLPIPIDALTGVLHEAQRIERGETPPPCPVLAIPMKPASGEA